MSMKHTYKHRQRVLLLLWYRLTGHKQVLTCWLTAARVRMRHVLTSCVRKLPSEGER